MAPVKRAFSHTEAKKAKKQKMTYGWLPEGSDDWKMADRWLSRYPLGRIGLQRWIMQLHANDIARDISMFGTTKRRYGKVLLVEVPESVQQEWLLANEQKAKMNPMLSNFENMICTGTMYATLRCTHFVEAQKLVMEGGAAVEQPSRRYPVNSERQRH